MQENWQELPSSHPNHIRRRRHRKTYGGVQVLLSSVLICTGLLILTSLGAGNPAPKPTTPPPAADSFLSPTPTPSPMPTSTPLPTPPPYDYSAPAPLSDPVEMDYFSDAVFIGDSRTDGLRLYSGIRGTTFLSYKGITVFDVMERTDKKVVEIDGEKYTILDALGKAQYKKVYVALGVNELGYLDSGKFAEEYGKLIDEIRRLQPDAEIYIQALVPVNPDKCEQYHQPSWLNNETMDLYNTALKALCTEKQVIFLNISEVMVDENGILPAEATSDGLHFTKSWYQKWLDYLMTHTVNLSP